MSIKNKVKSRTCWRKLPFFSSLLLGISAPLIVIISSGDGPKSWIEIGRLAERIMLYVQSFGYQTSIYVGSIEIGDRYKEVQKLTNRTDRPQFIFAIGHILGKHKITPRHEIKDKMI